MSADRVAMRVAGELLDMVERDGVRQPDHIELGWYCGPRVKAEWRDDWWYFTLIVWLDAPTQWARVVSGRQVRNVEAAILRGLRLNKSKPFETMAEAWAWLTSRDAWVKADMSASDDRFGAMGQREGGEE